MNTKASTFRLPMPVYSDQCTIAAELGGPVAAMYAASSGAAFSVIALPSFHAAAYDVSSILMAPSMHANIGVLHD